MSFKKSTSIFLISLATTISRILGLIREQIFAFILGASDFSDAFLVAFRIPNLLRDLFAEGALSTAFIPTFTKYLIKKNKKQAFQLANHVINFLFLSIGVLIILGYLFTPNIVGLLGKGYYSNPEKFQLIILLTKILMPFLLFISIASVFMGILNSHNKFFIPALAPAMFNTAIICTGILIMVFAPGDINKAIIWASGALIGGILQLLIQIPFASRLGYKYKPTFDWKFQNEGLRRIIKLMLPAVLGLAAVQINLVVNTRFASYLGVGAVSYLYFAFRLIWLPIGIFGVSIATVNTAVISRDIAEQDFKKLKQNIAFSLKMNSFLNIPSTIFFITLGIPIIKLLFQHGQFTSEKTLHTYQALLFYSPALFFYSGVKLLAPVFYAMKKSFIPVYSSVLAVIVNLIVSYTTYTIIGIKGLALGLASAAFINFIFLLIMFFFYHGLIKGENIFSAILKHTISAAGMGIGGYLFYKCFMNYGYLFSTVFPIIIAPLIYLLLSYLLNVKELHEFKGIFNHKFKKK